MAFSESSRNIKVDGPDLSADCQDRAGNYHHSTLSLNDCIGNMDGSLVWKRGGDFWLSCRPSRLTDPAILHAECRKIDESYVPSQINLDEKIANINGVLTAQLE